MSVVIVLDKSPASVRGELTKWMLEIKTGVFVGKISAEVRSRLWDRICATRSIKSAYMIFPAQNEQHFGIVSHGAGARAVRSFDGMQLLTLVEPASDQS